MPAKDFVQERSVDLGLFQHLLDPREILMPPLTGGDGNDVLGTEDLRGNSFVGDRTRFTNGFFGESGRGEKLNRETVDEEVFAFDTPTLCLQM